MELSPLAGFLPKPRPTSAGAPGSPPGYRWIHHFPEGPGLRWLILMVGAIPVAVLLLFLRGVENFASRTDASWIAAFSLLGAVGVVRAWYAPKPRIEHRAGSDGPVVRGRRFLIRVVLIALFILWFAATAIVQGIADTEIEPLFYGAIILLPFIVIAALSSVLAAMKPKPRHRPFLRMSVAHLEFSDPYFRSELPWEEIETISGDTNTAGIDVVRVYCPTARTYRTRTLSRSAAKLIDWKVVRIPETTYEPLELRAEKFGLHANSLLSTLEYYRTHPEKRSRISDEQLTAMLTAPPLRVRLAVDRRYK